MKMKARCINDNQYFEVRYASISHQLKYGAEYEEKLSTGCYALYIPTNKTIQSIETEKRYQYFTVDGEDGRLFIILFVR